VKVGIVGQGYVGLPLAVEFAERGVDVIALDVDPDKIACIQAGESYIEDVPPERLCAVRERIDATTRYAKLARADAIIICVPTPLTANREPELGPLRDCDLVFSPERVDPGRTDFTLRNTPKVVGGITDECGDHAEALYRTVCEEVVRVSTPEAAELTKLLENIFRSVNIALAMLTDRMGIDIWEVIDAASTKPYGFMRFDPGPGMGGHCLPVDPFYLTWRAREFDLTPEFIELAGKVNAYMPYYCLERVERVLNEARKPVNGTRIGLLGVAYKPGVGDTRESPALKLIELRSRGAELAYHDPHVPSLPGQELHNRELGDLLDWSELVVISTAHPGVDHRLIVERAPQLVDLRGHTRAYAPSTAVQL